MQDGEEQGDEMHQTNQDDLKTSEEFTNEGDESIIDVNTKSLQPFTVEGAFFHFFFLFKTENVFLVSCCVFLLFFLCLLNRKRFSSFLFFNFSFFFLFFLTKILF